MSMPVFLVTGDYQLLSSKPLLAMQQTQNWYACNLCILQDQLTATQQGSRLQAASVHCSAVMAHATQRMAQTAQPTQLLSCHSSLARAAV
jgi:hypothetical protein